MRNFLLKAYASFLGIGFLPAAPGSWATAAGVFVAYFLSSHGPAYAITTVVFLIFGIMSTGILERQMGQKDPGCLVIDEIVGILIALWGLPLILPVMICGFFLFRALDMFKIFPINKLEAFPGGWGIMLDDCMAGVYTNIILRLALKFAGFF